MGLVTTDIQAAATALAAGHVCAIPTETVYGLAANALEATAIAAVFALKGRPADHPLIVHVAQPAMVSQWISALPEWAVTLQESFMPGPLTLVGHRTSIVLDSVTGGQDTVAVRVPSHPVAHALLAELAKRDVPGLVAPSANRFGHVSPTDAQHVVADLGQALEAHGGLVLDGGPCAIGVESTIVLATGSRPVILRPGAVTATMVEAATGLSVAASPDSAPRVSGSLDSHYAPRAQVHVITADDSTTVRGPGGVIAADSPPQGSELIHLAAPSGGTEFAHELYRALRRADDLGLNHVYVVLPDDDTLADAIKDRVSRAASPRESGTIQS